MRSQNKLVVVFVAAIAAAASAAVRSQEGEGAAGTAKTPSASPDARKFLAPPNQVVALPGPRMVDARSGRMLANPAIGRRWARIAEACAGVHVPACAAPAHP